MYFFRKKGKQYLDLRGDLVITHNDALVKARSKSAGPVGVRNVKYIRDINNLGFFSKIKATFSVIGFIWGKNQALRVENIDEDLD